MKQLSFLMVVIALSLFSCKKDNKQESTVSATDEVTAASNNALSSNMFDDVYKQVDNSSAVTKDSCGGKKSVAGTMTSSCATITLGNGEFNLTTWPKHITVDFGTTGCQGTDGRTRKGQILYTASGWMRDSGSVLNVTTNNYYVDGYKIEGTKTITNNGRNSNHNLNWHVVVTNGIITHPDGTHHTWATDRISEWTDGEATWLNPWDDKFSTKGGANGTTTTGKTYTITINNASPLITQFGCRWIEQGILTLVVASGPSITINYGTGSCDHDAVATVNGVDYPFVMQ